jgi:hypothetical protein
VLEEEAVVVQVVVEVIPDVAEVAEVAEVDLQVTVVLQVEVVLEVAMAVGVIGMVVTQMDVAVGMEALEILVLQELRVGQQGIDQSFLVLWRLILYLLVSQLLDLMDLAVAVAVAVAAVI